MIVGGIQLPNSCAKILEILSSCSNTNGVSQQQLRDETGLSERAVKYAVKELKSQRLVSELLTFSDMRKRFYKLGGKQDANKH